MKINISWLEKSRPYEKESHHKNKTKNGYYEWNRSSNDKVILAMPLNM